MKQSQTNMAEGVTWRCESVFNVKQSVRPWE
jgi:hypothetical protein